ncbi:MAG: hypothetical protein JWR03_76, partial [Cohnella sp.]|nr:hypothetical protein [Cohnella sp.]
MMLLPSISISLSVFLPMNHFHLADRFSTY